MRVLISHNQFDPSESNDALAVVDCVRQHFGLGEDGSADQQLKTVLRCSSADLGPLTSTPKLLIMHYSNPERREILKTIESGVCGEVAIIVVSSGPEFPSVWEGYDDGLFKGHPFIRAIGANIAQLAGLLEGWREASYRFEHLADCWQDSRFQRELRLSGLAAETLDRLFELDLALLEFLFAYGSGGDCKDARRSLGMEAKEVSDLPTKHIDANVSIEFPFIESAHAFGRESASVMEDLIEAAFKYESKAMQELAAASLHPSLAMEAAEKLEKSLSQGHSIENMFALRYCWDLFGQRRALSYDTDVITVSKVFQNAHKEITKCSPLLQKIVTGDPG